MSRIQLLITTLIGVLACVRTSQASLEWRTCDAGEFNTTLSISCSSLRVPLDYTQPDSATFDLEIVKIPAAVTPSKGSILHNFGGPGLDARKTLVEVLGPLLQSLSGGIYDLLAFDPRGVGKTLPFTCAGGNAFLAGQIVNEIRSGEESDTALKRLWARGKVDATICKQVGNANSTAELIGTAFTARDFISVVDALEEDRMLRYWGFSYGTTLGATLAAMFPDRIDKMVLDGVQNPHDYYYANADFEEWTDTDKVFSYFFESCIEAGPEKCALATVNKTAEELELDTWEWFDFLRENPVAVGMTLLDLAVVKGAFVETLKAVNMWADLAAFLVLALYGSEPQRDSVWDELARATSDAGGKSSGEGDPIPSGFATVERIWGIHCGDRVPRVKDLADILPALERLKNISRLQGDVVQSVTTHCAQWPWRAKEVYSGDFHATTKNPVLIAGNVRDAHTPIRSAFNVSSGLVGSRVLQINGTGHSSISSPSACTLKNIAAYWVNGTLPREGLVCEAAHPWDKFTWEDVLKEA